MGSTPGTCPSHENANQRTRRLTVVGYRSDEDVHTRLRPPARVLTCPKDLEITDDHRLGPFRRMVLKIGKSEGRKVGSLWASECYEHHVLLVVLHEGAPVTGFAAAMRRQAALQPSL